VDLNKSIYREFRRIDAINYQTFDDKYRVDTSHPVEIKEDGRIGPGSIDNSDIYPNSIGYQNTTLHELDQINNFLREEPEIGSYKFIDVGSGKGRVILYNMSQKAPYGSYMGIEIDQRLHRVAELNMMSTSIKLNKEVVLVNQDILDYSLSYEPCVYFLFHPFSSEVYEKFIEKNIEIINKTNSYIVLVSPQEYDLSKIVDKNIVFSSISMCIYK
jgi:SAM-dependent methyltransferase